MCSRKAPEAKTKASKLSVVRGIFVEFSTTESEAVKAGSSWSGRQAPPGVPVSGSSCRDDVGMQ